MASRSKVTLRDVAAKAEVSVTTASEALRGIQRVDKQTRERVTKIAQELGYRTDVLARSLRSQRGRLIATAIPLPTPGSKLLPKNFWMRTHYALSAGLASHGIANIWLSSDEASAAVEGLPVEAVLWTRQRDSSKIERPRSLPFGVPVIGLGIPQDETEGFAHIIKPDIGEALDLVLGHLKEQGAKDIAFLHMEVPLSPSHWVAPLCEVWSQQQGIPIRAIQVDGADPKQIEELVAAGVDAFLLLFDDTSTRVATVLETIKKTKRKIPDDVMVLVWGESGFESLLTPPTTSVSFEGDQRGVLLADMIAKGLDSGTFETPDFPLTLNIRESTRRR